MKEKENETGVDGLRMNRVLFLGSIRAVNFNCSHGDHIACCEAQDEDVGRWTLDVDVDVECTQVSRY